MNKFSFMIGFEKSWCSWFPFQQLHPDTDDSVSEPEEEEVLLHPLYTSYNFKDGRFLDLYLPGYV